MRNSKPPQQIIKR